MRVLVTGGAGFIGSHIVDHCLAAGHSVAVLDNLSTGNKSNVSDKARFYEGDIGGPLEVIEKEKPEVVIHMAAQVNVRISIEDPVTDAEVNILGIINLLQASKGVKRLIFASSGGAIYGEQAPCSEESNPLPTSPYGIAKLASEHYIRYFGLPSVVLRLANVYGPRQDPRGEAGVISIFASKKKRNEPATIFGDGKQTRDYIYVEDVARAFVAAITGPLGTYNIGTGVETDVNELAKRIGVQAKHADSIPGEVRRNCLDNSKARKQLGWSPRVNLEDGLARTVRWIGEQI